MNRQGRKMVKVRTSPSTAVKRYAYDTGRKKQSAELICKYCNSIYQDKHWRAFDKLNPANIDKLQKSVCPSCHEERGHVSDGVVHIKGSFLKNHRKEIEGIILNCEQRELKRDVMNRVERLDSGVDEITAYTSKNQLAAEIGRKLDRAYKGGKLEIKWSKDDKPVDVTWHKDI
jgi:hypothetical protein